MTTLGPQCLRCKRRRVKCDSTEPTCNKCANDGFDCPGYTKALTWVAVRPNPKPKSKIKGKFRVRRVPDSTPSTISNSSNESCDDETEVVLREIADEVPLYTLITDLDKRTHTVLEALFYYNTQVCPDLSAVHWLGKQTIDAEDFLAMSDVFHNMIIVSVLATKALRYGCRTESEMYNYRGLVVNEMSKRMRADSDLKPEASLLMVLGMLSQEVYLSPIREFMIHLKAARHIVTSLGGVKACLEHRPSAGDLMAAFVITDVISTTTTPFSALDLANLNLQSEYVYSLDHFEDFLLDNCFPCPVTIFEAIIAINKIRVTSSITNLTPSLAKTQINQLLEDIETFNPWRWAGRLDCLPEDELSSQRIEAANEWATLASCYQSSAIIYLVESLRSLNILKLANMASLGTAIATEAHERLHEDLKHLHMTYPLRQATPEQPCLWRFAVWPLVVYTYGTMVLPVQNANEWRILPGRSADATLFDELRYLGVSMGSYSLIQAAGLLEAKAKSNRRLTWDEVFSTSGVFYM